MKRHSQICFALILDVLGADQFPDFTGFAIKPEKTT